MPKVYTGTVAVRHDELDCFGRVHPANYLRYLAHVAVDASTAAGFDAEWYTRAGAHWLVRRSIFEVHHPVAAGEVLEVRTWVEDVRRVRSHRCYEIRAGGERRVSARTDWVYVDRATARPRRVPLEMAAGFGVESVPAQERDAWSAPPPPTAPARVLHRVLASELDSLGHVNNAAYLDILGQAVLDALGAFGWPFDGMEGGAVASMVRGDVEYLDSARYGDTLEVVTWFMPAAGALDAHQVVLREGESRPLVRAATRWCWLAAGGTSGDLPSGLLTALRPLLAA